MKICNKMGLPQAIVNAVTNDPYDNKGTIPSAIWLFGSGLIGLIGFARHKKA